MAQHGILCIHLFDASLLMIVHSSNENAAVLHTDVATISSSADKWKVCLNSQNFNRLLISQNKLTISFIIDYAEHLLLMSINIYMYLCQMNVLGMRIRL